MGDAHFTSDVSIMRLGPTMLLLTLLSTWTLSARADEIRCPDASTRLRRDCSAEDALFSRRMEPLMTRAARLPRAHGLRASVRDAASSLQLARGQLCQDYNVCDVAPQAYRVRLALVEQEAASLARLLDAHQHGDREAAASLSSWAAGLAGRLSAASNATGPSATTPAPPPIPPQVYSTLEDLEGNIAQTRRALALFDRVAAALDGSPRPSELSLCRSDDSTIRDVRALIRDGGPAANLLSGLPRLLAGLCDPAFRLAHPTADDRAEIGALLERFQTALTHSREAGDCTREGEWSRECRRWYGSDPVAGRRAAASVADSLEKVQLALRGLTPAGPMRCEPVIWGQLIHDERPPGRLASDIRRIGVEARRVCRHIGVWPADLQAREESLRQALDSWRAGGADMIRASESARARLRASFHIHD